MEYQVDGVEGGQDTLYRLATSMREPDQAPAGELARLYHQRGEIETAFDELKTHLRSARMCLRSKTPELVEQEFYGLMLAHFTVRGLMHEASLKARHRSRRFIIYTQPQGHPQDIAAGCVRSPLSRWNNAAPKCSTAYSKSGPSPVAAASTIAPSSGTSLASHARRNSGPQKPITDIPHPCR